MKLKRNTIAAAILTASVIASYAYASDATPSAKKHPVTKKAKAPAKPRLKTSFRHCARHWNRRGPDRWLKSDLADKDARLKKAEQAASDAEVTAAKAQAAAANQNKAVEDNTPLSPHSRALSQASKPIRPLSLLPSRRDIEDQKGNREPHSSSFQGIALVPYGFFNGESAYRTHATGGEEATPWSSIPYEHADSYSMSETMLSGRQSRIGLNMEAKSDGALFAPILKATSSAPAPPRTTTSRPVISSASALHRPK